MIQSSEVAMAMRVAKISAFSCRVAMAQHSLLQYQQRSIKLQWRWKI
jgi:hypothetical protein